MDGPDMNFDAVQAHILTEVPDLSSELRKAARFLVDHPDEVALVSMRVLASRSEVTPTTFVRLARRLGFSDWAALRKPFENRLRSGSAPFAAKADALVLRGPEAIFAESLRTNAANLTAAEAANDGKRLRELARSWSGCGISAWLASGVAALRLTLLSISAGCSGATSRCWAAMAVH
ncbi:MurR/RpiR family transcriptional regulator [Sinorhizobium psoraleae]|uniref:HTH rpiR-type domain-containing protein n=1 Tax=Sinorhizobium psoraleae TaxID=520838 RepID=A0ABT4KPK9_9HYPH|nr:hypothetical protein [Sinorhizobium psoraleae]MCZ4093911.1 hypothetical protein [Sinorhizobium psoraleae]